MDKQSKTFSVFREIFVFQDYVNEIFEMVIVYGLKVLVALVVWCVSRFFVKRVGRLFLVLLKNPS